MTTDAPLTDTERRARLEELVKTDKTVVQIATALGFGSYHTFRLWLSDSGLEIETVRRVRDKFAERRQNEPLAGSTVWGIDRDGRRFTYVAPDGPRQYEDEASQENAATAVAA